MSTTSQHKNIVFLDFLTENLKIKPTQIYKTLNLSRSWYCNAVKRNYELSPERLKILCSVLGIKKEKMLKAYNDYLKIKFNGKTL